MNNEFPETRFDTQGGYFSQVNVKAMASFAVDLSSDNFSLESLPDNIAIQSGDLIRMVIRENPTTGYWWHSNARRSQDAPIREVYNGFEAPDHSLIGASGKRVLIFEVNDLSSELKLGLTRPGDIIEQDDEWEANDENEHSLDDHIFVKKISFQSS